MAIPLFLLVFVESAVLFQPSLGFEWKSSSPDDGANITACIGDKVTFPWEYTVGEDEVVLSTEWHKITDKETFLAAHTSGAFLKSPHLKMNVQFLPDAGIQISNYTWADFATYRVTVKYTLKNVLNSASRSVILATPDVPVIAGDRLVAHVQPEPVLDTDTGVRHVQLTCGQFLSLGSMGPESVVWRIPSGKRVPSTSYSNGSFHLTLPNPVTGGPYHCYPSQAGRCVKNMLALRLGAHVQVDEVKARLMLLKGGVEILQDKDVETDSELKRQKEVDSSLQDELSEQNATDNQLMSNVTRLEEKISNHTSDIANLKERLKTDIEGVQEELQEQQKTDTSLTFNISVVEHKLAAQNAKDNQLMSEVLHLKEGMSLQEVTDKNHTSDISNLKTEMVLAEKTDETILSNVNSLQEILLLQEKADETLSSDIQEILAQQEKADQAMSSNMAELHKDLTLQEKEILEKVSSEVDQLRSELSKQNSVIAELKETEQNLQSTIQTLKDDVQQYKEHDTEIRSDIAKIKEQLTAKSVSFHAWIRHKTYKAGDKLTTFGTFNNDDNAYNEASGVFTVPVSGTYIFLANVRVDASSPRKISAGAFIQVDGRNHGRCWSSYKDHSEQGSCHAIVKLRAGQRVWLYNVYDNSRYYNDSSFSGALLHADLS